MEPKDMLELPASSKSFTGDGNAEPYYGSGEAGEADMDIEEDGLIREDLAQSEGKVENEETSNRGEPEFDESLLGKSSLVQINVVVAESSGVSEKCDASSSGLVVENVFVTSEDQSSLSNHLQDQKSRAGVKRARVIYEEQASVHVSYSSLTRASKQKLEELMQQWSEWHAQHISSSQEIEVLESGEQTFFSALHVGEKKQSAVSFWIDHQPGKLQSNGLIALDHDSVPLYDRGYGLGLTSADSSTNIEGGLEIVNDAARCFNCGSYSHALKDCPRPRDNAAVTNARKQHMSKRNQNAASRSSTRYYEDAPAGKFDGLRPGCLDVETRKLLGLGELDPPPWLNRMRDLGYPPGYLDPDDDDQVSGIIIFADEETKEDKEDGEILEAKAETPRKKMSVEFPGINAPIPKNADERQWAGRTSSSDPTRHRSRHRPNYPTEPVTRPYSYHNEHYRSSSYSREDNPPPPGTESGFHSREGHSSGYGGFESIGRSGFSRPRSPDSWSSRFVSERNRWSPREDPVDRGPHLSPPHSYSSSRFLAHDYGTSDNYRDLDNPLEGRSEIRRNYSWR